MGWLFWTVVFLTAIYFLVRSSEFRKFALGAVALAALWLTYTHYTEKDRQRREASSISPTQIELSNLSLSNRYGSWQLTGLITNNSRYALRSLSFNVFIENCAAPSDGGPAQTCHVVGQSHVQAYVPVPSGQQRSLSEYVSLYDLPPLSNWSWHYADLQTTANLDET
jgi:hypothetical protein